MTEDSIIPLRSLESMVADAERTLQSQGFEPIGFGMFRKDLTIARIGGPGMSDGDAWHAGLLGPEAPFPIVPQGYRDLTIEYERDGKNV